METANAILATVLVDAAITGCVACALVLLVVFTVRVCRREAKRR